MLGTGPDEEGLRSLATDLGCASAIEWPGWVSDVGGWLSRGIALVMSSAGEGLCTSVLDAAMLGRTSIVTDAGGLPEAVVSGETGWVVAKGNAQELAQAIQQVARNPSEAIRRGNAARGRAVAGFSADAMVHRTWEAYAEVGAAFSSGARSSVGASPLSR